MENQICDHRRRPRRTEAEVVDGAPSEHHELKVAPLRKLARLTALVRPTSTPLVLYEFRKEVKRHKSCEPQERNPTPTSRFSDSANKARRLQHGGTRYLRQRQLSSRTGGVRADAKPSATSSHPGSVVQPVAVEAPDCRTTSLIPQYIRGCGPPWCGGYHGGPDRTHRGKGT